MRALLPNGTEASVAPFGVCGAHLHLHTQPTAPLFLFCLSKQASLSFGLMFSALTVAHAAFCVASCPIVILSLYFLPVIGVLGLTLGVVLCMQADCDPETPASSA